MTEGNWINVGMLDEVRSTCCATASGAGHNVAVFFHQDKLYAVDNRCPHMGFPLSQGSLHDGVLTCHWHHARFDLQSGGTFDPWADDVRTYPVEIRDGDVWVDVSGKQAAETRAQERLQEGLEQNIGLVIAKSAIQLTEAGAVDDSFRAGLAFGTRYREAGWGAGLTVLTCMRNVLHHLDPEDRPLALYHGLSAAANDADGATPRFPLRPLPGGERDPQTLKRWFRRFVEVREADGAERCLLTALEAGATRVQVADLLFAAATDHRYLTLGHALDFVNKALEALDHVDWADADLVLGSLVRGLAAADRMEESNAWRHPIDLVDLLEGAFEQLPAVLEAGRSQRGAWEPSEALTQTLLGDDPRAIPDALLAALRAGASEEELAAAVVYAAARRLAHFATSNEFSDWDTALHTFTFANAVHQGLRRAPSVSLLRGVLDAAASVYLDRFLNVPPAPLPDVAGAPGGLDLLTLLDRQQRVDEAGAQVARFLAGGDDPARARAALGKALLRENRDFHTVQMVEAAFRQFGRWRGRPEGAHVLVAAARYLAAHAPTSRSQTQTYEIAARLHRGERIHDPA